MSVIKAITLCGERYGFNISEAMEMLKRSVGKRREGKCKEGKCKGSFALPYNGELNENLCLGLNRNGGVYSQCSSERVESEKYCKQCLKEASNNSHGLPNYGNIVDRQKAYLNKEEFKDPSGKSPIAYTKIMKKLKLSEEQVRNECEKMGVTLDPINLEEKTLKKSGRPKQIKPEKPAKEIKAKGRPKKSKKVLELAGEEEDLFASLVMSSLTSSTSAANSSPVPDSVGQVPDSVGQVPDSVEDAVVIVETVSVSEPKKEEAEIVLSVSETKATVSETKATVSETKKEKKSSSAKEEKALAKLKEKEEKELAKLKEKEEKELAKLKEKEAKEEKAKEKEMKSLMLKLEKEKQKEELIEKKAALALEKVKAKELKEKKTKVSKKSEVKEVVATSVATSVVTSVANLDDEEADVVKKIVFEGKKYLKSKKTGIIYNMDQDVIGKWNEEKQRIDFNEEEESEDEYDEDM
jgi:hypothetical protein